MPLNITTGLDGIVENCIVSSIFLTCGKSTLILGFDKVTYNINLHIQDQVKVESDQSQTQLKSHSHFQLSDYNLTEPVNP